MTGSGTQLEVSPNTMWQKFHRNRTKKVLSQHNFKIHGWKRQVSLSQQRREVCCEPQMLPDDILSLLVGGGQWFHLSPGGWISHRGGPGIKRAKDDRPAAFKPLHSPSGSDQSVSPVEGSM